jgi:lactate/malate dehydrogenase, NAD binding domain
VEAFVGDLQDKAKSEAELEKALQGVQLALIPAGVPRKPGMTRDDLFNTNAGVVQHAHLHCAPSAVLRQQPCRIVCVAHETTSSSAGFVTAVCSGDGSPAVRRRHRAGPLTSAAISFASGVLACEMRRRLFCLR